ncbi:MAG: neutral/alkaline non-lysosomal ceramidase N-terminal domain-containing protein [Proteobacteria bacterium]|nr:neutral/alkaline non-lysosomal ceramidase N-terminal domain-containing protein [Pseudomonadota bacterium]
MLLLLSLLACTDFINEYDAIVPGPPVAGAAQGDIRLPVGTPLGGFTARVLDGITEADSRDSAYTAGFIASAGVHTYPTAKVVWIENGDDHLVLIKVDLIYSFDGLVQEVRSQLEDATGENLDGKVVITANHTHQAYGPFSDQPHFYLGGDRFNQEIFVRMAEQISSVAVQAYDRREPAAIGIGWEKDWDPEGRVYSDRRGVNSDLQVWDDQEDWETGKDPYLGVLRVDTVDGDPIALAHMFGIHGIALGEDNAMVSGDAAAAIEDRVSETFDHEVVVMHMQTGAGDCSPRGDQEDSYARLELLGERAVGSIVDLWDRTPTSSEPMRLETASRHIWQHHDQIQVTRNGTVDWYYPPTGSDPEEDDDWVEPDNEVWGDDGKPLSPFDEFNAPVGAAFCGDEQPFLPIGVIEDVEVYPYNSCTTVDVMMPLVSAFVDVELDELPTPVNESYKAGTTASRLGPIPMLLPDGSEVNEDLLTGFFPAEVTSMFAQQWRRRASTELDYTFPLPIGYAQDHEGYFLIPEDWLMGGYEPNINLWGPLQGEHVMEGVLTYAEDILGTDVHDDPDPVGYFSPTEYRDRALPTDMIPDMAPDAGTRLTNTTRPEYLWTPLEHTDLDQTAQIERVTGRVELAWIGGDPMVDIPLVTLQRDNNGTWETVTTHAGRPVTEALTDVLLTHTPFPLKPVEVEQTHYWWAGWQAVGHTARTDLPAGTYRLHVAGQTWAGGDTSWPWSASSYEVTSDAFEVVPATLEVTPDTAGVWVNFAAAEAVAEVKPGTFETVNTGWRLIDPEEGGHSTDINPVRGEVTVDIDDGLDAVPFTVTIDTVDAGRAWVPADLTGAITITVTDAAGNTGTHTF